MSRQTIATVLQGSGVAFGALAGATISVGLAFAVLAVGLILFGLAVERG